MSTKDTSVDIKQTGKDSSQCENIVNNKKTLLVLDSNVLLNAMRYNEVELYDDETIWRDEQKNNLLSIYLENNKDMVRMPWLVYTEVIAKINEKDAYKSYCVQPVALREAMYDELLLYYGFSKNTEYSRGQLFKVEEVYALDTMSEKMKKKWIESKKYGRDPDKSEEERLKEIHGDAENDRRIIAYALTLAEENHVYLITDDSDFWVFSEKIVKLGDIELKYPPKVSIKKNYEASVKRSYDPYGPQIFGIFKKIGVRSHVQSTVKEGITGFITKGKCFALLEGNKLLTKVNGVEKEFLLTKPNPHANIKKLAKRITKEYEDTYITSVEMTKTESVEMKNIMTCVDSLNLKNRELEGLVSTLPLERCKQLRDDLEAVTEGFYTYWFLDQILGRLIDIISENRLNGKI